MYQVTREISPAGWSGRFSVLAALVGLGLLLTASGARAGCAVPNKFGAAAPAIPFASSHEDEERDEKAGVVGLWHVIYTGTTDDNFPPGGPYPPTPFQFLESFKTWHADGTEFENAFLSPTDGNICFGQSNVVKLNGAVIHFDV